MISEKVNEEVGENTGPEGNKGFLVKEGKSTFVPRVRIKVTPVEE